MLNKDHVIANWQIGQSDSIENINCFGTLFYDKSSDLTLELVHDTKIGLTLHNQGYCETIHGDNITLFYANLIKQTNFKKSVFNVEYCLNGRYVESIETPVFDRCSVRFPYLRNWAFERVCDYLEEKGKSSIIIYHKVFSPLLEIEIEDGIKLVLNKHYSYNSSTYESTLKEDTILQIHSEIPLSVRKFLEIIYPFRQFLSIALYGEQNPCEIEFRVSSEEEKQSAKLFFKVEDSYKPFIIPLLKYNVISHKIPKMIKKWYFEYDKMYPICDNLIKAMHVGIFEVPDFLLVAHALDGFYKRFLNKKDGRDIRKYGDEIKLMLERFKDVKLLQKCNIDVEALSQSRNKYSHLIPDDVEGAKRAVEGVELLHLTRKATVLLICCIMDCLGLSNDEINKCFEDSQISQYIGIIAINTSNE